MSVAPTLKETQASERDENRQSSAGRWYAALGPCGAVAPVGLPVVLAHCSHRFVIPEADDLLRQRGI